MGSSAYATTSCLTYLDEAKKVCANIYCGFAGPCRFRPDERTDAYSAVRAVIQAQIADQRDLIAAVLEIGKAAQAGQHYPVSAMHTLGLVVGVLERDMTAKVRSTKHVCALCGRGLPCIFAVWQLEGLHLESCLCLICMKSLLLTDSLCDLKAAPGNVCPVCKHKLHKAVSDRWAWCFTCHLPFLMEQEEVKPNGACDGDISTGVDSNPAAKPA